MPHSCPVKVVMPSFPDKPSSTVATLPVEQMNALMFHEVIPAALKAVSRPSPVEYYRLLTPVSRCLSWRKLLSDPRLLLSRCKFLALHYITDFSPPHLHPIFPNPILLHPSSASPTDTPNRATTQPTAPPASASPYPPAFKPATPSPPAPPPLPQQP